MENTAQIMTVSELFIYRWYNKKGWGFLCKCACICVIFTYFGTKNRIYTANTSLLNMNLKINWYFKPSMPLRQCFLIVGEVGFIHHGRMTSYNLWRHLLHTHSQVYFMCFILIAHFFFFFLFSMNTETTKNHYHEGILIHIYSSYWP